MSDLPPDPGTLLAAATRSTLETVKAEKPSQFTIGAYIDAEGRLRAASTYDRKWVNGWGATAYVKAWWNDLSVTAHPKFEAGAEVVKKF